MDVNSNKYTIGFSLVMVVIVALILAFASESLKPMQKKNVEREKMQNILQSVGLTVLEMMPEKILINLLQNK